MCLTILSDQVIIQQFIFLIALFFLTLLSVLLFFRLKQFRKSNEQAVLEKESIAHQLQQFQLEKTSLTNELEKAIKSKYYLFSNITHEIRTPLNGIIGAVEMLRESSLSYAQLEKLSLIESSAQVLLTTLNDIIDVAKINHGQIEIKREEVDFLHMLNGLYQSFLTESKSKRIKLNFTVDDNVPKKVYFDQTRLNQLIYYTLNYLVTNSPSIIDLEVKSIHENKKMFLQIRIQDNGDTILNKDIDEIMNTDSYLEMDNLKTRNTNQISLAISYNVLIKIGGRYQFVEKQNKGNEILILYPYELPEFIHVYPSETIKKHILLVEDNTINQKVAEFNIRKLGHDVIIAGDGKEAFELFCKHNFDMVFMDLQMPVMDGYESTRLIRKFEKEHGKTPAKIILMTAFSLDEEMQKGKELGMDDFIAKPFKMSEVKEVIDRNL